MKIRVKYYWQDEEDFKEENFSGFLYSKVDDLKLEESLHFLKESAVRLILSNMSGKPLTVDDIHSMIDLSDLTIEPSKE